MKKKLKNNIVKGSLLLIIASFLIFLTYEESIQDRNKELISLMESTDKVFEYISINETLEVLKDKTGVILFINDKKDINNFLDLLYNKDRNLTIYVCNVKNDETILKLDKNNNVILRQRPSKAYKNLLDRLGAYAENYYLKNEEEIIETDYKRINTPMVLFIKNGNILFSHYIIEEEELSTEELLEIYDKGFELIEE